MYYCSAKCQKIHWKEHESNCIDVEVMHQKLMDNGASVPSSSVSSGPIDAPCGICHVENIEKPVVLECKHAFCFDCLNDWQQCEQGSFPSQHPPGNVSCPCCRANEQDIESTWIDRATLFLARANRKNSTAEERQENFDAALAEIEKVLDEGNQFSMQALYIKMEILFDLGDLQGAADICKLVLQLDGEESRETEEIFQYLEQCDQAVAAGDTHELNRLNALLDDIQAANGGKPFERLEGVQFEARIKLAEIQEAMEDWSAAKETYMGLVHVIMKDDEPNKEVTPPLQRMIFMGLSRCYFELEEYGNCICGATDAIKMNRHFPEVHKYLALAQRATGDLDGAVITMTRAVLYETPWDDENVAKAVTFLHELNEEADIERRSTLRAFHSF
jgi:tetratricopeptide (TPR) repeat protein